MRLIDADALMDSLDSLCDMVCPYSKIQRSVMCGACPLGAAFDVIDTAPTVDPVKHGHWINANEGLWNTVEVLKCSVCGEIDNRMYRSDAYCPYCGAKMDEVEDETD